MKMKKIALGAFLSVAISFSALAQSNQGQDYLLLGETKQAQEYFSKEIGQNPAEANYFLGEIAYKAGDIAKAKSFYEKALAATPDYPYAVIGLAKLDLKSNQKDAESRMSDVQKKNKKNVQVILAIAQAYQDNGLADQAQKKLDDARKADKKSPWVFIYEGDALAAKKEPGQAAAQYDQAINFDPSCTVAYMKGALVYESINYTTALSLLNKVVELNPNYHLAYKYIGKISTQNGLYPEAIEAYKKYFASGEHETIDLTRYASSYFFTKQYDQAINLIEKGLETEPNNFVLNRLMMYSSAETQDYVGGLPIAQKFFSIPLSAKDTVMKYIDRDFMTYAKILVETGNTPKAIEEYKKAIALDPSNIAVNKEIATVCANEGLNAAAAEFYKKYIDMATAKNDETVVVEPTDYYQLGRYYYLAGTADLRVDTPAVSIDSLPAIRERGKLALQNADAAFATVVERIPESYLGSLWRARTNASLDPETTAGLARPYYEKTIELILAKDDHQNDRELSEAYRYLSYYTYLQFDKAKTAENKAKVLEYCEKLLALDPTNAVATQLKEVVNQH